MMVVPRRALPRGVRLSWAIAILVLCQVISSELRAQGIGAGVATDSTEHISFEPVSASDESSDPEQVLRAIISGGGGIYRGFDGGEYKSMFQPTVGIDFYTRPGGWLGLLLGGHFGLSPRFTQGLSFGVRQPLKAFRTASFNPYLDISALFFDDKSEARSFETGARLGVAADFDQSGYAIETRIVGEFRGSRRIETEKDPRYLWWAGVEAGLSFSLIGTKREKGYKDSVRATIRHIADAPTMEEFDQLTSHGEIDRFLDRFWAKRDVTPDSKENEARKEFERRIVLANAKFGVRGRLGAETDPGRVILIYGVPNDEVTDLEVGETVSEYMLWVYRQRIRGYSTAAFLFRRSRGDEWMQIYSNVGGERSGVIPRDLPQRIALAMPPFLR